MCVAPVGCHFPRAVTETLSVTGERFYVFLGFCHNKIALLQLLEAKKVSAIKKFWKITGRLFAAIGLVVYVTVALVNYSVVQSLVGSLASSRLSEAWGGEVRIASMGCNPFNHLVLRDVSLVSPTGDTICRSGRIVVRFDRFPVDGEGLELTRVLIEDTYYHLQQDSTGLNLRYIIDYYKSERPKKKRQAPFVVRIDEVVMEGVTYRQDLRERASHRWEGVGVDIPHMEYSGVSGRIRNLRVDRSHITCQVDRLTTRERSGLEVRDFRANVYVTPTGIGATDLRLETADSRLEGDVLLDYESWKSMKHFIDSVRLTCRFEEGSYGGMRDAAYWAPVLWGMDEQVAVCGSVDGPVSDLHVDGMRLAFGDESRMEVTGYISGLPHMDTTVIGVDIRGMHTSYADLLSVKHPRNISLKAASLLKQLDKLDLDVSFNGTIYDFHTAIDMRSPLGDLRGDVTMAMDPKKHDFRYAGELESDGFAIGKVAPNEWVGRTGLALTFEGKGVDPKTMRASCEGRLHHIVMRGQRLSGDARFTGEANEGSLTAEMHLDDPLADVDVRGGVELHRERPVYSGGVTMAHVDLKRLGLWTVEGDSAALLEGRVEGRYSAPGEGRHFARVQLSDVLLRSSSKRLAVTDAVLTAREQHHWKNVTLQSEIVTAQLRGYYSYGSLPQLVKKITEEYIPGGGGAKGGGDLVDADLASAEFELDVEWLDSGDFLRQLIPSVAIARGTRLQANYNYAESLKTLMRSDSLRVGPVRMQHVGLDGALTGDRYRVRLSSDVLQAGELRLAEQADFTVETESEGAWCRLRWFDEGREAGNVEMGLVCDSAATRLTVSPSRLTLAGEEWLLRDAGDGIVFFPGGFHVGDVRLESGEQLLSIHGDRRGRSDDRMEVVMRDFGLDIVNPYLQTLQFKAGGEADGVLVVGGLDAVPYLNADLSVSELSLNDERLGDARVRSTWNGEMNQLNLHVVTQRLNPSEAGDTWSRPLECAGYVGLASADPELYFNVTVDDVALETVRPLLKSFSSEASGRMGAELEVGGTLSHPDITGTVALNDARVKVDFLNVTYRIDDTITLDSGVVRLDHLRVEDPHGDVALVDGVIRHNHLSDIVFDLSLHSDRFVCMHTGAGQGTPYYGHLEAECDGRVRGPVNDMDITIDARTLPGSTLSIPVSDNKSVKRASYIHFEGDEELPNDEETYMSLADPSAPSQQFPSDEQAENRWRLTIRVDATPDLALQLPIRTSLIDADIATSGHGELELAVGADRPFSIMGDYELQGGKMGLNLLGVVSNEFAIDEGSSITFPGAIADAMFDIKAVYSQRVNLSTLTGSLNGGESQKPIQVENVIALSGTIESPAVNFDIRLPNADQSVQEEVFAYIDRNNERDMLQQTASLLIFKRFYNNSGSGNVDGGTDMASEGYGLVANSLGNVVSGMVQFVDVNFAYKAGNALTTDQYAVDISKEWNKFYFETTLGFGGEAREMESVSGNNNMTGDMLVGYKINPRLHLFVFNRSNTNDYTRSDLPYKQGVGVKYTRDFDRFSELFRRKKK